MDDLLPLTPDIPPATDLGNPPRGAPAPSPSSSMPRPSRYDANARLIHLRRVDAEKTAKARPWWKPGS